MATYVLVHGAFLGGWCWRDVAARLRAAGHDVFAPTLTGLGERYHLATPDTDLETNVQDIIGVIDWEDLNDIVLVGHSYAGMVVGGVAGRHGDRIKSIIYLDAHIPRKRPRNPALSAGVTTRICCLEGLCLPILIAVPV